MAVTYQLQINSDLPKDYVLKLQSNKQSLTIAKKKYEELIDFVNMNQLPHLDQLQLSKAFFDSLETRFVDHINYFSPHIFTRYASTIVIQQDDDNTPVKINLLTDECNVAILTKVKNLLLHFNIHRFGIVLGWKIINSDNQVFCSIDELTQSFKKLTFTK